MSKIFKPRRGKASTMNGTKKNTVLAQGEFFMEVPDTGVGTGKSKIKMGDGSTAYSNLPYALGDTSTDKINLVSNSATTVAAALNSMANGNTLGTQLGAAKQACSLLNNGVTKLNEELPFKFGIDSNGNYGYYKAGADTVTPFKSGETFSGDIILGNFGTYNLNTGSNVSQIQTNLQQAFDTCQGLMNSMSTDMKFTGAVGCFNNQKKYKYMYLGKCNTDYTSLYYRIYQNDGTYVQNIIKSATTGKFNLTAYKINISNADIITACPYCSWTGTGTRQISVVFSNNEYDGFTAV